MKLLKVCTSLLIIVLAMQLYADPVRDEYSALITTQPSYEKFQKNFDDILGKIEQLTELGQQTQDRTLIYPICVALQSSITALKNNQQYRAQYDRDYKQFDTSFDETLAEATQGLTSKKQICADAQKEYFDKKAHL